MVLSRQSHGKDGRTDTQRWSYHVSLMLNIFSAGDADDLTLLAHISEFEIDNSDI